VAAAGLEQLATAPPAEFDGPGDRWSPESLLAAAVASCFILTFRSIARASQLQWSQLDCDVEATLERREGVMQFTRIVTHAKLTVSADASTLLCERALNKAEEGCLVANSLRAERHLQMEIVKALDDERETESALD
jgi:organic hydroperoxide reductase OsmC/OhrA